MLRYLNGLYQSAKKLESPAREICWMLLDTALFFVLIGFMILIFLVGIPVLTILFILLKAYEMVVYLRDDSQAQKDEG